MDAAEARSQAAKIVRYLGTAAAAREMAQRTNSGDVAFDFLLGFVSSPAREAVLDQMKALLVDPDFPVYEQDLCGMSVVALPPDATDQVAAEQRALEARFRDELRAALKNKRGRALEVSTYTVNSIR